jgi:hypothetical protein
MPKVKFNIAKLTKVFAKWRSKVAERVGSFASRLKGSTAKSSKSIGKWIKNNKGLAVLGAAAGTTALGYGLSKVIDHTDKADEMMQRSALTSEGLFLKVKRHSDKAIARLNPEDLEGMSSYEKKKRAVDAGLAVSQILISNDDEIVSDFFLTTVLIQVAVMRTGFSLVTPEDHSHLIGFVEDFIDSMESQIMIDTALMPLALGVADEVTLALEEY